MDMSHAENVGHREEKSGERSFFLTAGSDFYILKKLLKKILDKFLNSKYTKQVTCESKLRYRGLVKWYDRGLQNLWWEFDSLIPCYERAGNA